MSDSPEELRAKILDLTREYARLAHSAQRPAVEGAAQTFVPGVTTVPYGGRVFTEEEVAAAVGSALDFWLTLGKEGDAMEAGLAEFLGVKRSLLVNSGSSANLLALAALTSAKLGDDRLRPGDEVITCAAGFPTTVAPIVQNQLVPVFIDNNPQTGNADCTQLEAAFSPGRTKAVMMAHALGNPFDLSAVLAFCRKHGLWLIEDNCDALGSTYTLPPSSNLNLAEGPLTRLTGAWGDLSTQSFYPPHHLTMGEGGAVNVVNDMRLKVYVESFRDWGRDCWCASGKDDTCGKRFGWQLGELPKGYDHKYTYSHLGYNLKPLDLQAAIGREQLLKLPSFVEARKANWNQLRRGLAGLSDYFEFSLPTHATAWASEGFLWDTSGARTECSWFGFLLLVRSTAPFKNTDLARFLDSKKIGNRMFFGGNLVRQPAFVQLKKDDPAAFRIVGDLKGADQIMTQALFIGVYPGLSKVMLDYAIESVHAFVNREK